MVNPIELDPKSRFLSEDVGNEVWEGVVLKDGCESSLA